MMGITIYWRCIDFGSNTYKIFDRVSNTWRPDVTLNSGETSGPYTISADDSGYGNVEVTSPGGRVVGHDFLRNGQTETL